MGAGVGWARSTRLIHIRGYSAIVKRAFSTGLAIAGVFVSSGVVQGQVRGVYPLGMSAVNGGMTPEPGFTYSNLFLFYSRDQFKDLRGAVIATGENSVMMDMNSFVYVTNKEIRISGWRGIFIFRHASDRQQFAFLRRERATERGRRVLRTPTISHSSSGGGRSA